MQKHPFDEVALAVGHSRRTVIGSVAVLAGTFSGITTVDGKKKRKKRCAKAGQPTSHKRKRCCAGLMSDARGVCNRATPVTTTPQPCKPLTCPTDFCGKIDDGCRATLTCGCDVGQTCMFGTCRPCAMVGDVCQPCIMVDGVCQPCDVLCESEDPDSCAVMPLQAAISGGGSIYVCPGRYSRSYSVSESVKIIGAGDGDDPSTNTILGYPGNTALQIEYLTGIVELEQLRISDGHSNGGAGGISHGGTTLRMTDCTVSGNTAHYGAGIMVYPGRTLDMLRCKVIENTVEQASTTWGGSGILTDGATTLTDCLVASNHGSEGGGGIYVGGGTTQLFGSTIVRGNSALRGGGILVSDLATLKVLQGCLVTGNKALEEAMGGGIAGDIDSHVLLMGVDPSPIVVNNCPDNCSGPVPKCAATPVTCQD